MTLYRHFGSKDELVCECLRDVARDVEEMWNEVEAANPGDPLAQLRAWVRLGAECANSNDGRGCDMANAAVELADTDHPARQVIEEFKRKQRDRLARLAHEAGIADSELLADTLVLLLEGARVSRQSVGPKAPARISSPAPKGDCFLSRQQRPEQVSFGGERSRIRLRLRLILAALRHDGGAQQDNDHADQFKMNNGAHEPELARIG